MSFWKKLLMSKQEYGTECVTLAGQKVKSRAEKRIADYFFQNSIRYEYEKTARAHFFIFSSKISKPDFYLTDYNVYVEFWGLLDVEDKATRSRYEKEMRWKMAMYHKHKIMFISLYPSNLHNLDWIFRKKFQDVTGVVLPKYPDSRDGEIASSKMSRISSVRNFCTTCGVRLAAESKFCHNCGARL